MWGVLRGLWANGALFGANGAALQQFWFGFAAVALLVVINNTNNVITIFHDLPRLGVAPPIIWEASSGVTILLFLWIPWLAFQLAPPDSTPIWRTAIVHGFAAVAFSVAHVAGFVLIRQAVYFAAGSHYGYAPLTEDFAYEFRKDALSYVLIIAIFWGMGYLTRAKGVPKQAPGPAHFDIRDGARLLRVPVADILAVTSADNYVEFVLRDGRRLMMRKALSAVETELGPHGFLRTHRSWLVNPAQMTALKPEGSGDYSVELGALAVPLSRRFPDALAKLRAG